MLKIDEVILVEGRYDKNTLSQIVDATIIETCGFGIFHDKAMQQMISRLAKSRGIIILTDSDGAGFVIRNKIKGFVPKEYIKHVYIPDIYGKEKRKAKGSKEGKLGVEGMTPEILLEAFRRAGITAARQEMAREPITKTDLYKKGLTGKADSANQRRLLMQKLDLPERLTADGLLEVLNILMTREEFLQMEL